VAFVKKQANTYNLDESCIYATFRLASLFVRKDKLSLEKPLGMEMPTKNPQSS